MRKFLFLIRVHPESQSGKATCNQIEIPNWPIAVTDDVGNTYSFREIAPERGTCSWHTVEHRPPSRITIDFVDKTTTTIVLD